MEKKWWHNSVVYQIYPRSFNDSNNDGIGDLQGIIEKLDYLKDLGIDVIWLSPVYKSPMEDFGYDIADYQAIDPMFGTMDDMDQLLKEATERGIKILMDLVVNHTSAEHSWFKESEKSKDNPYRDYYVWRDEPNDLGSIFGGSAWEYDENTEQYYLHMFAKRQPDLNWENPVIAKEIHQMINWWLEKGLGGFRLDVIDMIGKEVDKEIIGNGPTLHEKIQKMNKDTFGNYDVLTVGETWGATPEIAKLYSDPKRNEFSMVFQFEHASIDWDKDHGKWKPGKLDFVKLKEIFEKWQTSFDGDGWNSLFWNNHDLPRIVSRWGNDSEYRVESAKMLAISLHMMQGTPYIFQGEEIGMTNIKLDNIKDYQDVEIHGFYQDKVLDNKVMTHDEFMNGVYISGRDNARTPMQWDSTKNAGFTTAKPWLTVNENHKNINVEQSLNDKNSIFNTYKKLVLLRKNETYSNVITFGDFKLLARSDENIFAYTRTNDDVNLLVVTNWSEEESKISFDYKAKDIVVSNYQDSSLDLSNLKLRPYEAIVFKI